ncbi:MAG: 30S ribosomal protein S20 [Bacteroidales bacterium]|nr:30S ribosomal protein S20 [Bacteroidales bacterium]
MAHHKSAKKRIRQNEKRRLYNRYYKKTAKTLIKKLKSIKEKQKANEMLPSLYSFIDKIAKKGVIHKNKAANLKSNITKYVNSLS